MSVLRLFALILIFGTVSAAWMRRIVRWLGPETLSSLVTRLVPRLAGDAAFFVSMATQTLHRNPIVHVSPILHATGGGPDTGSLSGSGNSWTDFKIQGICFL